MRILILTQYYPPEIGAAQIRLQALARGLHARGHAVDVVTALPHQSRGSLYPGYERRLYADERDGGVRVQRTWVYAATGTGFRRLLNYASFAVSCVAGLARARRPDVVFIESPPLFLVFPGLVYASLIHALSVVNVSDLWPDSVVALGVMRDGPLVRAAFRLEAWAYRAAQLVGAATDGVARALRDKGVPDGSILPLPNGTDAQLFRPLPRDEALARELDIGDRPIALFAGTHGIAYDLLTVIEAAAIAQRRCDAVAYVFVGDGHGKQAAMQRARHLGLSNVRFVDSRPLEEMPRYFSLACASLAPIVDSALSDGVRPSRIAPSLAAGVPVIFSGNGDGARLLHDAGAGVVVPPASPGALAAAVDKLASDVAARREMGERGRRYVLEHLTWDRVVSEWLERVERMLESPLDPFGPAASGPADRSSVLARGNTLTE